jgi:hypothetical protein
MPGNLPRWLNNLTLLGVLPAIDSHPNIEAGMFNSVAMRSLRLRVLRWLPIEGLL